MLNSSHRNPAVITHSMICLGAKMVGQKMFSLAWTHLLLSLAVLSLFASGFAQSQSLPRAEVEKATAELRGQKVYNRACIACHARSGDGNGPAAKYLNPLPRDFTAGTFKFRSTPSGDLPTDQDLYDTITNGIPRTMMPAWEGLLTEKERHDVVAYVKTFSDKFRQNRTGTPIKITPDPGMTPETLVEGKSIYMIMECWACHGTTGKGDGKSAKTLKDDWGHKIKPFNFTLGNYKGGEDPKNVYKTFNTGLNGTPMPSYAEAFLFGGDGIGDLSGYREAYSASEVETLKNYLAGQPKDDEIGTMSETELHALAGRRSWSLVHFVKSLSHKPGLFHKLFVEDTEVTKHRSRKK